MCSGSVRQEARDGCRKLSRRRRLLDDGHVGPHAPHKIMAAVEEEWDAPFFEKPTELRAVRIANLVVDDGRAKISAGCELAGCGKLSGGDDICAGRLERLDDVERSERFVLDDEDRTAIDLRASHAQSPAIRAAGSVASRWAGQW